MLFAADLAEAYGFTDVDGRRPAFHPMFEKITADYRAFAAEIGLTNILAIPISGLKGDNITSASAATPWYGGPTLIDHLETVPVPTEAALKKRYTPSAANTSTT